jgi:DMSO/TMAO reductase YedYZ molybdopterin-dependent catalytic subunit
MPSFSADHNHDPFRPHSHDPNPTPPSDNPDFIFIAPDGAETVISLPALERLPRTTIPNCYIVSTGHGTSGPFTFSGARLLDLIQSCLPPALGWSQVEVISADGFGNRVMAAELLNPDPAGPALLSYNLDGQPLTRQQGLVRLIVPSEKDDALRQVKWVGRIIVRD